MGDVDFSDIDFAYPTRESVKVSFMNILIKQDIHMILWLSFLPEMG